MNEKKGLSAEIIREELGAFGGTVALELPEEVDSTNLLAKRRGTEGAPAGLLVAAGAQTAGRGRLGRDFASPRGGLYMSLLLRPSLASERLRLITPAAAVAVCRAADAMTGGRTQIKWVNDVFFGGGKVAGILTEAVSVGEETFVVVGIGVNVTPPDGGFPPALEGIASVLFPKGGAPELRSRLCGGIVRELLALGPAFDPADFVGEYRDRSCVLGRDVTVVRGETRRAARALAIDDDCRLGVKYRDGSEELLFGGEISVRL